MAISESANQGIIDGWEQGLLWLRALIMGLSYLLFLLAI